MDQFEELRFGKAYFSLQHAQLGLVVAVFPSLFSLLQLHTKISFTAQTQAFIHAHQSTTNNDLKTIHISNSLIEPTAGCTPAALGSFYAPQPLLFFLPSGIAELARCCPSPESHVHFIAPSGPRLAIILPPPRGFRDYSQANSLFPFSEPPLA